MLKINFHNYSIQKNLILVLAAIIFCFILTQYVQAAQVYVGVRIEITQNQQGQSFCLPTDTKMSVVNPNNTTWIPKNENRRWMRIAMSDTGQYQTAVAYEDKIYVSNNYGNTWTAKDANRNWYGIAMSSDGKYQTAIVSDGKIYVSNNYGYDNTWTAKPTDANGKRSAIAMSDTGQYQTAVVGGGKIYVSNNYGNTWTATDANRYWSAIAMSDTGQYQTAVAWGGKIYISNNYGYDNTWTPKLTDANRNWYGIAMSSDGRYQTAVVGGGKIYVSNNYGNTWTATDANRSWYTITMSDTGQYQTAVVGGGKIYVFSAILDTKTTIGQTCPEDTIWSGLVDLQTGKNYDITLETNPCAGYYSNDLCWFAGNENQSCTDVCFNKGGTESTDCRETDTNCEATKHLIGDYSCSCEPYCPVLYYFSPPPECYSCSNRDNGDCETSYSGIRRVCACKGTTGIFNYSFSM